MKTLPKLYKLSSKAKLLEWEISVAGNVITTRHGQVGGKIQAQDETIKVGKNVGRANETTPEQQALSEAESEWEKQVSRKGYVADRAKAEAGESDQQGELSPMLAQKYTERAKYITWPCYGQPKLDGMRILAVFDGEKTELWSRERKPIAGLAHVADAVTKQCKAKKIKRAILDGEAYKHELKKNFGKIISLVKKAQPGGEVLDYNVYDCPLLVSDARSHDCSADFDIRTGDLAWALAGAVTPLVFVETRELKDWAEAKVWFDKLTAVLGYEGEMLRNAKGAYADGARSNDLQKVKEFDEDEFEILGVEEGTGKFDGLAVFVCRAANGKEFRCNPPGELDGRKLADMRKHIGEPFTVQYFGLTDKEEVPRFPTGKAFRTYEK